MLFIDNKRIWAALSVLTMATSAVDFDSRHYLRANISPRDLSPVVKAISPEFWPEEEFEHYKELNDGSYEKNPYDALAQGPHAAMTVETSNALATHIGTKVLQANGTAADAAIASAAANIVLAVGAYVSFAGVINAVYFDSTKNETKALNGHYMTVPENDPSGMERGDYPIGALTPVPAFFATAESLIDAYGSGLFTLGALLEPAAWLAEQGVYDVNVPAGIRDRGIAALNRTAFGQRLLALFEDGSTPETIPQPEVAALLRNISENGVEYFYKGDWAKEAVAILRSWGSNITMDHFATYYDDNRPEWQDPQVDELTNGRTMHSIGVEKSIAWPYSNTHRVVEAYNIMHALGLLEFGDSDFSNNGTVLSFYLLVNRYGNYMEWLARHGLKYPSFIYASFTGPLAPVEESVWLFDPVSAAKYRTSKQHAQRIANAMQSREGIDKLNKVIDFFTVFITGVMGLRDFSSGGQHSDGIVVHDKHGNSISMLHTINDRFFGTGLFVQGVALPSSLWLHSEFLQGPWNDRSKSVTLPIGHSVNLVTSKDGLPETLTTAVADTGAATIPLVLLTSGWGRTDLAEVVNGPAVFPAPFELTSPLLEFLLPNLPGQNPFHSLLFTLDASNNGTCDEYCWLASPFPTEVTSDLETWISPYTHLLSATDLSPEVLSLDIGGMGMPATLRIQSRNDNGVALLVEGASTKWGNGIADPVPRE